MATVRSFLIANELLDLSWWPTQTFDTMAIRTIWMWIVNWVPKVIMPPQLEAIIISTRMKDFVELNSTSYKTYHWNKNKLISLHWCQMQSGNLLTHLLLLLLIKCTVEDVHSMNLLEFIRNYYANQRDCHSASVLLRNQDGFLIFWFTFSVQMCIQSWIAVYLLLDLELVDKTSTFD